MVAMISCTPAGGTISTLPGLLMMHAVKALWPVRSPSSPFEFARPTRLEDVIGIRAIDDVGCSFEHDNKAIGAFSDVK
jgi:hypothetical protein